MKYKLQYMDLALRDMAGAKAYLSGYYPGTWPRFAEKLKAGVSALASTPYMCEVYRYNPAYRCLAVDDYLVFYKVSEPEKVIQIHRIIHGAKNIQRYLDFSSR